MKKVLILALALMLGMATAQAAAFEKEAKYKATNIVMSAEKPLVVGNNTMKFAINKKGEAVRGAKVSVKAFMPAMPGMPYMEYKADAKEVGNGVYEAVVNYSMGGTWQIHIFITPAEGKKSRVKTSVNL